MKARTLIVTILLAALTLPAHAQQMMMFGGGGNDSTATGEKLPMYQLKLEVSEEQIGKAQLVSESAGVAYFFSSPLRKIAAHAYGISPYLPYLVTGPDSLLEKYYTLESRLPRNNPELQQRIVQAAIEEVTGLTGTYIEQEVDVYLVKAPDGVSRELYHSEGDQAKFSTDEGVMSGSHQQLSGRFLSLLGEEIGRLLIDETGLDGHYDFQLLWDAKVPESIIPALREQLGLVLEPTKRRMRVLELK